MGSMLANIAVLIGTIAILFKVWFGRKRKNADVSENVVLPSERQICCSNYCEGKIKIAIVGSGASGSATAYWLRKMAGDSVEIHVFEKGSTFGGRIAKTEFNGRQYEYGATVFHTSNLYLSGFCRLFGLRTNPVRKPGSRSAIYNGQSFLFKSSGWSVIDSVVLIFQFGLRPLLALSRSVNELLSKFSSIYHLQASGRSFTCPQDFVLSIAGTKGLKSLHVDGESHLISSFDLPSAYTSQSRNLVRSMVSAGTRCNYGQTTRMLNGFCAHVSCAGTQTDELFSISGGNIQLIKNLLDSSKAKLHMSTAIKGIIQTPDDYKFVLNCKMNDSDNNKFRTDSFDAVVLACPIEGEEGIQYSTGRGFERNLNDDATNKGYRMHRTVVTFVHGVLKHSFLGLSAVYTESFAAESLNLPWNSVGLLYPVDASPQECQDILQRAQRGLPSVFKVFSQIPLKENELNDIFASIENFSVVADWLAYPSYGFDSPQNQYKTSTDKQLYAADSCYPFVITAGLFSTSAIERVSSAAEMALISGYNAALLVREHLIATKLACPVL